MALLQCQKANFLGQAKEQKLKSFYSHAAPNQALLHVPPALLVRGRRREADRRGELSSEAAALQTARMAE